jgi:hypothetical protein
VPDHFLNYELGGREFESLRARQIEKGLQVNRLRAFFMVVLQPLLRHESRDVGLLCRISVVYATPFIECIDVMQ